MIEEKRLKAVMDQSTNFITFLLGTNKIFINSINNL